MELKIRIRTPMGKASATLDDWKIKTLKKVLFRQAKIKEEYVNKRNDTMYWVIECDVKRYLKICRSIGQYTGIVAGVFDNKRVRKGIRKMADSEADYEELRRLIEDGTRVEIVKEATASEMVDADKTFWERMKWEFKKLNT